VLGAPLIGLIIRFLLETQADQIASYILRDALSETTSQVAREILKPIVLHGAALGALGFGMILAAFLLRRKTQL
jgi:hypothetical protein